MTIDYRVRQRELISPLCGLPAGLGDDHLGAELVELVPEILGLEMADRVSELLAVGAFLEQRVHHRRDALAARAASIIRFRLVLGIDRLGKRRGAASDPGTAGFPFCNSHFPPVSSCRRMLSLEKNSTSTIHLTRRGTRGGGSR